MKMLPSKKHWMTVFAAAALCLATGTALADDGRRVGGYQMIVGWVDEPAYAGIKNGVELRVTRMAGALDHHAAAPNASGTTDMAMSQHHSPGETQGAGTGNGMAMSGDGSHGSGHGEVEAASPMSVSVMAAPDPVGGVNVHIQPRGFTFTPENADMPHVEGEGHAHIYVDGKKVGRAYTPWMHVGGVSPGEHTVRVTLNSNSHGDYTVNGKVAEATAQINIPDEDSGSHGRADLAVRHARGVYVFEFKIAGSLRHGTALAQIKTRGYADKYLARGKPVYLVGVEFSSESRNVERFEAERIQ